MIVEPPNSPLEPSPKRPPNARWLLNLLPLILIGLGVHLLLPQIADLEKSWQTLIQMTWWLVALAVLAQFISYLGFGYLLASLAAMVGEHLEVRRGALIALAGGSVGLVAAGMVGSAAAVYRWINASGVSQKTAGLCSTLPTLFNNLILVLIAILGLSHLLVIHELTRLQAVSFSLILIFLILLVISALYGVLHPEWLRIKLGGLQQWWATLAKRPYDRTNTENTVSWLVDTYDILRRGGWRGPVLGAILNTAFDILTLYFVFLAAGHTISPGVLLTGYGLPLLIGKVSFLPGGVGIVEATMAAIYVSMNVPNQVIPVVILGYRLLSFWFPTLLGFPAALYLQRVTRGSQLSQGNKEQVTP